MDEKERKRLGCTSDRDIVLPDGRVNHVLEVQNLKIDASMIFALAKKRLETKEK